MSIVIASVRASVQELLRLPSFLLPLAVFPTVLYIFLGLQQPGSTVLIYLGYCAFAILGTMMFQFGVGIAATRDDPWNTYTLTLPGREVARAPSPPGARLSQTNIMHAAAGRSPPAA